MLDFYVYAHYTLDTNELFYIGKGRNNRAFQRGKGSKGRNNYWHKIVNKHGYRVEMLISNLKESDAFIQEILAIKEFSPRCNFNKGGEGISGYKHTIETKRKMSEMKLGVKQTKETINKRIKKGKDHHAFGKQMSEEVKRKISETKKKAGLKTTCKKVYCMKTNKIWNSIVECADEIGMKRTTLNMQLLGQNRNKTTIKYLEG